jgi:hypothetical protein
VLNKQKCCHEVKWQNGHILKGRVNEYVLTMSAVDDDDTILHCKITQCFPVAELLVSRDGIVLESLHPFFALPYFVWIYDATQAALGIKTAVIFKAYAWTTKTIPQTCKGGIRMGELATFSDNLQSLPRLQT